MTCTPSRVLNLIERMINTVSAVNSQESMVLTLLPAKIWGSDGNGVENLPHQIKCGFPSSRSYEEHHSGSPTWISGVDNLAWRRRDVKWKADQAYQMATVPPKKKKKTLPKTMGQIFPFYFLSAEQTERESQKPSLLEEGQQGLTYSACVWCVFFYQQVYF